MFHTSNISSTTHYHGLPLSCLKEMILETEPHARRNFILHEAPIVLVEVVLHSLYV